MILPWEIFFFALGVGLVGIRLAFLLPDEWVDLTLLLAALAGLVAFVFLVGGTIVSLERHYGRIGCHTFAAQTGRHTKFIIYTRWDGGDCLTPDGNGHWIPTKNLREFGTKP